MDSFIVDDVNALLNLKKGDSGRLNQIKEICEANGIVPISDRKYIERLASQYLNKVEKKKPKDPNKRKLFSFDEPGSAIQAPGSDTVKIETEQLKKAQNIKDLEIKKNQIKPLDLSSNKKIMMGIGAIILAIILVVTVSTEYGNIQIPLNSKIESTILSEFSLETDLSTYGPSDIISISGRIPSVSSGIVNLTIYDQNNKFVWSENLNLKKDGSFSTLLIAGGDGWENSGKFTLNAEYKELSNKISFDFMTK